MRFLRDFAAVLAVAPLVGCASSTGILPAGPETYTLTERMAPVRGGSDAAQREALLKGNEFCQQKGLVFVPNNMGVNANVPNQYGPTGYSVTFRCLPPSDPAVASYRLQQAPNLIVEQRNR